MYQRRGLGDAPVIAQQSLTVGAGIAPGIIAALGVTGPWGLVAGGILEAGSLIAGLFETDLNGKQKIATTSIVNQLEPYLDQNVQAYLADPTVANQQAALANFDQAWAQLQQLCGQAQYGQAGQNCIADRQPGGKFDWFKYLRDPIANTPPKDAATNVSVGGVSLSLPLILGAGAVAFAVLS